MLPTEPPARDAFFLMWRVIASTKKIKKDRYLRILPQQVQAFLLLRPTHLFPIEPNDGSVAQICCVEVPTTSLLNKEDKVKYFESNSKLR